MPFCPKCHYEYRPGISVCPDCNETLVDVLPPEESEEETSEVDLGEWVHLARLTSKQSADMLIAALYAEDIPAVLRSGSGHFGITGQMGPSSFRPVGGGYSLFVPESWVVAADRIALGMLGEEWLSVRLVDIEESTD